MDRTTNRPSFGFSPTSPEDTQPYPGLVFFRGHFITGCNGPMMLLWMDAIDNFPDNLPLSQEVDLFASEIEWRLNKKPEMATLTEDDREAVERGLSCNEYDIHYFKGSYVFQGTRMFCEDLLRTLRAMPSMDKPLYAFCQEVEKALNYKPGIVQRRKKRSVDPANLAEEDD